MKKLLADFIRAGGRVYVCAHCLDVAGMKSDDLVTGAQAIDGTRFLELLDRDTITLTY